MFGCGHSTDPALESLCENPDIENAVVFENKIMVFRNEFYWTFDIQTDDPETDFGDMLFDDSYRQMREMFDEIKTSIMGSFTTLKEKLYFIKGYKNWLDWKWTGPSLQPSSRELAVSFLIQALFKANKVDLLFNH